MKKYMDYKKTGQYPKHLRPIAMVLIKNERLMTDGFDHHMGYEDSDMVECLTKISQEIHEAVIESVAERLIQNSYDDDEIEFKDVPQAVVSDMLNKAEDIANGLRVLMIKIKQVLPGIDKQDPYAGGATLRATPGVVWGNES